MAKPPSSSKRDNEKKRQSKLQEKQKRKEERKKNNSKGAALEEMFAYVDENGVLTSTPPDLQQKKEQIDLESIVISTPKKTEEEQDPTHKGRVEFFNEAKGFGFIKELSGVNKYFFHISSVQERIKEGDIVFFELVRGTKDMNAVNIRFEEKESVPSPDTDPKESI